MHPGWVIICQADYYFSSSWLFCTFSLLKRKLKRRFKIISSSTTSASPLWALPLSSLCPSSVLPPSFAQESKNDIFREDMTLSPVVLSCMYWSCIMTCLSYTWVKWESGTQNSKQYLSKVHRQKTRMMRSMLSLRSGCYCIWIFSLSLFRSFINHLTCPAVIDAKSDKWKKHGLFKNMMQQEDTLKSFTETSCVPEPADRRKRCSRCRSTSIQIEQETVSTFTN